MYIRGKSVVCHDLFGVCACVDCMPWGGDNERTLSKGILIHI